MNLTLSWASVVLLVRQPSSLKAFADDKSNPAYYLFPVKRIVRLHAEGLAACGRKANTDTLSVGMAATGILRLYSFRNEHFH